MSSASTALAPQPSKIRSKITNDPAQRHGRSAEGRRVRDLFRAYAAALGNPQDNGTLALILSAAEGVTIAEKARADHIAGNGDLNSVVRAEGAATRALRRLGLNRAVTPPRKSFAEKLAEVAAQQALPASPVGDVVAGADVAADADQRSSELALQASEAIQ